MISKLLRLLALTGVCALLSGCGNDDLERGARYLACMQQAVSSGAVTPGNLAGVQRMCAAKAAAGQ